MPSTVEAAGTASGGDADAGCGRRTFPPKGHTGVLEGGGARREGPHPVLPDPDCAVRGRQPLLRVGRRVLPVVFRTPRVPWNRQGRPAPMALGAALMPCPPPPGGRRGRTSPPRAEPPLQFTGGRMRP